jgi:GDP-4-dehydro-6-deoxy-D-mannose reductase
MKQEQKFLITGISGFAGAHLAQLLFDEGHEVHGLIRGSNGMETDILDTVTPECFKAITFHYGNLEDQVMMNEIFKNHSFDGCFHLAAQSHPPTSLLYPVETYRTNVMGSIHLIEAIAKYDPKCKLMFCSTSEVYGNSGRDGGLLKESDPLTPSNPYAASKAAIDLYMQERMTNRKITGFITRAFSHTGIRRGKNFSISADAYQIARILKGYQEPVVEVGNLDTVRVVIDVKDVVNAYYLLMMTDSSNGKIFNVCGDVPRKMGFFTDYLIGLAENVFGEKGKLQKKVSDKYFRPIDIAYQHGDTTELKSITGWEPKIKIENTLGDLLSYWLVKIG